MKNFRKFANDHMSLVLTWMQKKKGTKEFYFVLLLLLYAVIAYGRFIFFLWSPPLIYENSQLGYSTEYPASWVFDEYTDGYRNKSNLSVKFRNSDYIGFVKPTTKVIEIHHRIFENGSIDDVMIWGRELHNITGGASYPYDPQNITISSGKYPAILLEYRRGMFGTKQKDVYLLIGEDGYIIKYYHAFWIRNSANNLEEFEHILGTFKVFE